ncbi:uncharacterized protein TNCV_72161 [Trichonephila clavipes]|nr:uncharacterized protein TNCV_72161 [Trichonephila clavipes]
MRQQHLYMADLLWHKGSSWRHANNEFVIVPLGYVVVSPIRYSVPARHGSTLNCRRAASPLVRLVEGEERWEASDHLQSILPLNWGEIEPNRTVTCMVLKATANDWRHLAFCHDEFRGPRSGLCRSGGISNNKNNRIRGSAIFFQRKHPTVISKKRHSWFFRVYK